MTAAAYKELFGQQAKKQKKQGKKAKKRERKVIKKLKAKRGDAYVELIVARGRAFKAETAVTDARRLVRRKLLEGHTEILHDAAIIRALRWNDRVRSRAKKALAREGIRLHTRWTHGQYESRFRCFISIP